ncbi:2Fe-2S iron-sulfur cluster-binding protein [Tardiphaga sp. 619_E2_N8_5]|uniref:2Fe-2S iron-sulfur cluster-binding protein n=1 Tax=unclassified Tardiphaga TaxID=2631404 RepID=UPI003F29EC97
MEKENRMVVVNFIHPGEQIQVIEAVEGQTVMQAALGNMVSGIVGECGGGLSCATCHVFVDQPWFDKFSPPSDDEKELLDATSEEPTEASRLACQLPCTASVSGMTIRIPKSQR